jgi:tetratricopeptide (TPR) repeat protein
VCEATLEGLESLVDKSLLGYEAGRFVMLETIREYAGQLLEASGEAEALRRRHCEHVLAEVEAASEAWIGGSDPELSLFAVIDDEHDNLRRALEWAAAAGEAELEVRLAVAARWYWMVRGQLSEGRSFFDGVFARTIGAPKPLRALALVHGASFPFRQGDTKLAARLWEEALDLYRELGDEEGIARSMAELGGVAIAESDLDRAAALYEETAERFRSQGRTSRLATALSNLGAIANIRNDPETAVVYFAEAIELARSAGDEDGVSVTLHNLARSELALGRLDRGREALEESLSIARQLGYREVIAYCLSGLAELAMLEADAGRAATLLGASQRLFDDVGAVADPGEEGTQERIEAYVVERLGADRAEQLRAAGAAAAVDELLDDVACRA